MTNRTPPQLLADRKAQIMEQSIEIHELNERVEELTTDLEAALKDNARLRALVKEAFIEGASSTESQRYKRLWTWFDSNALKALEGE